LNLAPVGAGSRGFTLLELIVVIAIIGVLAALAVSDLSSLIGRYRLNSAARELAAVISECRMTAISDNRECAVQLKISDSNLGGDWRANAGRYEVMLAEVTPSGIGWTPAPDGIADYNLGPHKQPGISLEAWQPIAGPIGQSMPSAIVFNPRGFASNPRSDFAAGGVVRIVLRNKRSSRIEQRVVRVDHGGNVQIAVP
jgi:prepilin-type N-terminal cleavage/methylation domain-containing protein